MKLILIGGFLGSGKTTILKALLHSIDKAGQTAAVIENEIGEVGIDDQVVGGSKVAVTPLFGGCVCCQITGSLMDAIGTIKREYSPDWLLVELTGLALMDSMRSTLTQYGDRDVPTYCFGVADSARWDVLSRACGTIFEHQLRGVDAVLLTKTDVQRPSESMLSELNRYSDAAPVIDAAAMTGDELFAAIHNFTEG